MLNFWSPSLPACLPAPCLTCCVVCVWVCVLGSKRTFRGPGKVLMCLSTETLRSERVSRAMKERAVPRTGKKEKSRGAMECGLGPSTSYYYYYYHWKVLVGNRPHGKVNYLGWAEYVALGAAGWLAVAVGVLSCAPEDGHIRRIT